MTKPNDRRPNGLANNGDGGLTTAVCERLPTGGTVVLAALGGAPCPWWLGGAAAVGYVSAAAAATSTHPPIENPPRHTTLVASRNGRHTARATAPRRPRTAARIAAARCTGARRMLASDDGGCNGDARRRVRMLETGDNAV
ncbi:hypothetical protein QTP88_012372 [Uroleucon formosanum]